MLKKVYIIILVGAHHNCGRYDGRCDGTGCERFMNKIILALPLTHLLAIDNDDHNALNLIACRQQRVIIKTRNVTTISQDAV